MSIRMKILAGLNKEKKEIYSFKNIFDISGSNNEKTIRKIIYRMIEDKRLVSLKAGLYLYVPEGYKEGWSASNFWIGANLVDPYAISFWSALNHWGLTEQLPNRTFIQTTKSVRMAVRKILNNEYRFIRLSKKRIFGLTKIWVSNHQVNITDQEKTLADCLAFPQYCGGISEAGKGLYNFLETSKLKNLAAYTQAMGQPALKRLGYLFELMKIVNENELKKIKKLITNPNFTVLEPLLPAVNSERNSRWKLEINVAEQDLLKWKTK